jgi:hypothetical protein
VPNFVKNHIVFVKVGQCPNLVRSVETSVPDLYGVLTVQLCGMCIIFILIENFVSKGVQKC